MKTICKVEGVECPKDLGICCGTCEHLTACNMACESVAGWQSCTQAEVIHDELVQFQAAVPEAIQKIANLVLMKKQLED